jgi:hypothetical protein
MVLSMRLPPLPERPLVVADIGRIGLHFGRPQIEEAFGEPDVEWTETERDGSATTRLSYLGKMEDERRALRLTHIDISLDNGGKMKCKSFVSEPWPTTWERILECLLR